MLLQWFPAFCFLAPALLLLFAAPAPPPGDQTDQLTRLRTLGKAFYENPTTQKEAVEEFRKALALAPNSARERLNFALALLRAGRTEEGVAELERVQKQAPSLPHTWFNLAIAHKKAGDAEKATAQMEGFIRLVADDPISHYNLGALYKLAGQQDEAIREFTLAATLDPAMAAPHFQLYNAYRTSGRPDEARQQLTTFQAIKKQQEGAAIPEDVEWNAWCEVLDVLEDRPSEAPEPGPLTFETRRVPGTWAGAIPLDALGDGKLRLLLWSATGALKLEPGLALPSAGAPITMIVPADYNNDGLLDLCLLTIRGTILMTNAGAGKFVPGPVLATGNTAFTTAVWLDYDHDYDLDLFLLGAKPVLLRNAGSAGFQDRTADFPFVPGEVTGAASLRVLADTKGFDLAVALAGRSGVLYRDRLQGKYTAEDLASLPASARNLVAADVANDGFPDLLLETTSHLVRIANEHGIFRAPVDLAPAAPPVLADLENRGLLDLVTPGSALRNTGKAAFTPVSADACRPLAAADLNEDGLADVVCAPSAGVVQILINRSAAAKKHAFLKIRLAGVKNLKRSPGAEVEVKAGSRYQKQISTGAPLLFGLGSEKVADTVRITWPNGLIQNEIRQPVNRTARYEEAQRLSGSCPIIWTWDGTGFRYITDVLGVAPLGAASGDGTYFPVDHDEFIQIPSEALRERPDHQLEVRITEELSEVAYLDQFQLLAVDHPASSALYTNEKFKGPPFPEFRLFEVNRRIAPIAARDDAGRNVLATVLRRDRTYPTGFHRELSGVAELHHLDLDFGKSAPSSSVLVLSGWVDWADGSTFLGVAQEGKGGLIPPYLQVKDDKGRWVTALEDMGMPAGKPKIIVVDLAGKWKSASREVRIVTNLCVYWDEIFLTPDTAAPTAQPVAVPLHSAELRFRGFSPNKVHPQRLQPEEFQYEGASPQSLWNPTPGSYTLYGNVLPLAREVDDQFIVMGSGDEVRLTFDASAMPPVRPGFRRDYLLKVDGWAKDRDANTAHSQSTGPLPYHAMAQYPYGSGDHFPSGSEHIEWQLKYLTRPELRLIPPLRPLGSTIGHRRTTGTLVPGPKPF